MMRTPWSSNGASNANNAAGQNEAPSSGISGSKQKFSGTPVTIDTRHTQQPNNDSSGQNGCSRPNNATTNQQVAQEQKPQHFSGQVLQQQAQPPSPRPQGEQQRLPLQATNQTVAQSPPENLAQQRLPKPANQQQCFSPEQLKATDGLVRLPVQSGTNKCDSQTRMTGFDTQRNTKPRVEASNKDLVVPQECPPQPNLKPKARRWTLKDLKASDGIIPCQNGTNRFASQKGQTGFGMPRDVNGKHLHHLWMECLQDDYLETQCAKN